MLKALLDHLLVHRMSPLFLLKVLAVLMMLVLLMGFVLLLGYNSQKENSSSYTEVVKEKEELKTKLEIFQSSSKGLSKLLNSQMSKRDKSGLWCGDQVHNGVLSYENEVRQSVFDSRLSDVEDSPVHDRFANVEGMHAVPPPMTGNYIPPGPDREVDDSMFTYGPKQSKTSKFDCNTPKLGRSGIWVGGGTS
ncbi:hypothetical protein Tco_1100630 [Tanacetum coccineum]